jgi:hypothetical protein
MAAAAGGDAGQMTSGERQRAQEAAEEAAEIQEITEDLATSGRPWENYDEETKEYYVQLRLYKKRFRAYEDALKSNEANQSIRMDRIRDTRIKLDKFIINTNLPISSLEEALEIIEDKEGKKHLKSQIKKKKEAEEKRAQGVKRSKVKRSKVKRSKVKKASRRSKKASRR